MTDERFLRDALRAEAEHEPLSADAWAKVATASREDERRRMRRRVIGGAGAAVLATAAAVSIGLIVINNDSTAVVTNPGSTVPAIPSTTPAPGTTASSWPDTTIGSATTAGPDTTPADTTPAVATTASAAVVTTVPPVSPTDPVLAVTADGRVVTLSATDGSEITQLGAVQPADGAAGIGVSQTNGVGYYSGPYETTGRIWKVLVAGGAPEQIAFGSYPAISPDGTTLAFVEPPNTIVLFDVATNQEISSTTWDPNDSDFFHLGGSITRLEWSPDGTALVFQSSYEGSELLVFRPGADATLTDADPVAGVSSPTWVGNEQIESIHVCCYPEDLESREVRIYALGSDEPVTKEPRRVVAIDRRPDGTRSVDINIDDPAATFAVSGTLTLRGADGAVVWQTADQFFAVSV